MSDTVIHFITSEIAGSAIDIIAGKELLGVKHSRTDIIKKVVTYGIVGIAVDLDHIPYIFQIDSLLKLFSDNALNSHRPFHYHILLFCLFLLILLFIINDLWGLKYPFITKVYILSLGVSAAVLSHMMFDYIISCYIIQTRFSCFLADPATGAKLIQIFK